MLLEETLPLQQIQASLHPSFESVSAKLFRWISRFSHHVDSSVLNDLMLFYLKAGKKYLDHRTPAHLCKVIQSIYIIQKKLIQFMTLDESRWVEIRLLPTCLDFPFISQTVVGCLVGFNTLDRYELFDQENIKLILGKHFPHLQLVTDSFYLHPSQNEKLHLLYFEISKKEGSVFNLQEQTILKESLQEKLRNNIQRLSPAVFNRNNQEEIYKNLLILRKEIQSTVDLPQALINLDEQTSDQIVFLVSLVYINPYPGFSLSTIFANYNYIQDQHLSVGFCESHPIEAYVFRIYLERDISLLRSDGSWNFFAARQKIVQMITSSLGEFRDYNGGILLKQQELLHQLKEEFPEVHSRDPELLENFFYAITPLEMQATLPSAILFQLFESYLEYQQSPLREYHFESRFISEQILFIIQSTHSSLKEMFLSLTEETLFIKHQIAYILINDEKGIFIQGVIFQCADENVSQTLHWIEDFLKTWYQKLKPQKLLRVGFDYEILSLDPRIGGDHLSQSILSLLFEGLTRLDREGKVENGIAESIKISPDGLIYTFKLRPCVWNTQAHLSAHDFAYAWKKVLSPQFKTSFAYFFYPIKNSKAAKEGNIPLDQVGIEVIDDRTLRVYLEHPAPYFLQLIAHPIYSPVHHVVDQHHPQWPYQTEYCYPCNGPFCLKIHYPNQGYHLVKNEYYWDKSYERLDQIIFHRMTSHQGYEAFRQGTLDWIGPPLGSWAPFFSPHIDNHILSLPHRSVAWFTFNVKRSPFSHPKIRQAFAYAIDRDFLVQGECLPLEAAYSPLPFQHSCSPNARFPYCNASLARQLWEEGLQELKLSRNNLPRFTFLFYNKGVRESIAAKLQAQLKETLGFECDLKVLPWKQVFEKMIQGDFQLGLTQWASWVNDPIYTLNGFKYASEDMNIPKWENPTFQALLDQSDRAPDLNTRFKLLAEAEKLLCKAMPIIPLYYQSDQALIKSHLHIDSNHARSLFNFVRSKQT